MNRRDLLLLIMTARKYYELDQPLPVDTYMELSQEGLCPEQLEEMFEDGLDDEDITYHYYESTWAQEENN